MKYAFLLSVIAIAPIAFGQMFDVGYLLLPLAWVSLSFFYVAFAYFTSQPIYFGKRSDGSQSLVVAVIVLPYRAFSELSFVLYAARGSESGWDHIDKGVFVGRRPIGKDCEELTLPWTLVVDLAAEFPRKPENSVALEYLSLPCLDGTAPSVEVLQQAVEAIARTKEFEGRRVLIHCALGHGRSATVAAAFLLDSGAAASVDEAVSKVESARPGAKINAAQRAALELWWDDGEKGNSAA